MKNFQTQENKKGYKYDLEERTIDFSIRLIKYIKAQKYSLTNKIIFNQLVRSGTSIGANYTEANGAESKKDFVHKIAISKKEAKESLYWLIILYSDKENLNDEENWIKNECNELILILNKIYHTSKKLI